MDTSIIQEINQRWQQAKEEYDRGKRIAVISLSYKLKGYHIYLAPKKEVTEDWGMYHKCQVLASVEEILEYARKPYIKNGDRILQLFNQ